MHKEDKMRTTLDLPEELVKKAMKTVGARTKTAAITQALEELIRKYQIQPLKRYKGRIDLDIDLDASRDRP
jgi:hypothetical protein